MRQRAFSALQSSNRTGTADGRLATCSCRPHPSHVLMSVTLGHDKHTCSAASAASQTKRLRLRVRLVVAQVWLAWAIWSAFPSLNALMRWQKLHAGSATACVCLSHDGRWVCAKMLLPKAGADSNEQVGAAQDAGETQFPSKTGVAFDRPHPHFVS